MWMLNVYERYAELMEYFPLGRLVEYLAGLRTHPISIP
jgi:hypothetical protein